MQWDEDGDVTTCPPASAAAARQLGQQNVTHPAAQPAEQPAALAPPALRQARPHPSPAVAAAGCFIPACAWTPDAEAAGAGTEARVAETGDDGVLLISGDQASEETSPLSQ